MLLPLTLLASAAHAGCEITKVSQTEDERAAKRVQLPGQSATPGKVHATATVLVKVQ